MSPLLRWVWHLVLVWTAVWCRADPTDSTRELGPGGVGDGDLLGAVAYRGARSPTDQAVKSATDQAVKSATDQAVKSAVNQHDVKSALGQISDSAVDQAVKSAVNSIVTELDSFLDGLKADLAVRLDDLQSGFISELGKVRLDLTSRVADVHAEVSRVKSKLTQTRDCQCTWNSTDPQPTPPSNETTGPQNTGQLVAAGVSQSAGSGSEALIDCSDLPAGSASGVHVLRSDLAAFCDMETDGGGWTVFQRRADVQPRQDFFLGWDDYKAGFGDLGAEFWWGLENLWAVTRQPDRRYQLRIELGDFEGQRRTAEYGVFRIGPESDGYRLLVSDYSGDAGDSLSSHSGFGFVTKDLEYGSCAVSGRAAWWYNACGTSDLNGPFVYKQARWGQGITWGGWRGVGHLLKTAEMKFRPTVKFCTPLKPAS